MREKLNVITREEYERVKNILTQAGYSGFSKYRKGMKSIKLAPIVLRESK